MWTTVPRALLKSTFFSSQTFADINFFYYLSLCVCALDVFFPCVSPLFYHNLFNHHIWPYSVFLVSCLSCIRCLFYHQPTVFVVVGVVVTTVVSFFSFPPFFWAVHLPQSFRIHEPRSHNTTTDQHTQPYAKSSSFIVIIAIIAAAGPFHPQIPTPYLLMTWTRALKSRQVLLGCAATQNNVGTCARGQ